MRAKRRFDEDLGKWKQIFDLVSSEYLGTNYAPLPELQRLMMKEMTDYPPEVVKTLFLLMDYDKVEIVEEENFIAVMSPWAAFSACDINNDNSLDTQEMEKLFWLTDGKRPAIS